MRRRDFLSNGIAFTTFLATRHLYSTQRPPPVRAAVVVGVDRSGSLPVLNAAASGARMVAKWLGLEGFEVSLFVTPPVTASSIYDAIARLVDRGTLDQLVIYFSGHGFLRGNDEFWLLSGAPLDPNQAVSLRESLELARETAIPSIVFISDACRSTPDSLGADRMHGSVVFPNTGRSERLRPEVDRFLAALPGDPALEVPVLNAAKDFAGIYTSSFLDAFKQPDRTMVRTVSGVEVVTNRGLKNYLQTDVPKRAEAKSIKLHQTPDAIIESGDTTYLGRVVRVSWGANGKNNCCATLHCGEEDVRPVTVSDLADAELRRTGVGNLTGSSAPLSAADEQRLSVSTGFGEARKDILNTQRPGGFETDTGFSVNGIRVKRVSVNLGMNAQLQDDGDGLQKPAIINVETKGKYAATAMLHFADGSGTVIAALAGYIGTINVDGGHVVNVSYVPSQKSGRWDPSSDRRLLELRATVATAARFGVFRIDGDRGDRAASAARLADNIRLLKSIDPTLGLYAAYAYAEADLIDQVKSVFRFMSGDLRTDLFDVAMLAGVLSGKSLEDPRYPIPFCPMLSQGWGLLRVKSVRLSPYIERARAYLRPSLWNTFGSEGMEIIDAAFRDGKLG